jgi:hypothetical protein
MGATCRPKPPSSPSCSRLLPDPPAIQANCGPPQSLQHNPRERIRQIEAKALRKMKHPTRARQLRSFLDDA